jgi:hypothetical protein
LELRRITLGAVVPVCRDMGGREKRGVFLIFACIYKYIEDFEEQYLLLLTKSKCHESNPPYSGFPHKLQIKSNVHISIA